MSIHICVAMCQLCRNGRSKSQE